MNVAALIGTDITDADIAWGRDAMGLPPHAFSGEDNSDPRVSVLKRLDSLDVEACPGSGKTTLLVTKLAILAKKWQPLRAGVCVLSHTNVARNEIEEKLGPFPEGAALLRYPHFVGTIHSFVNEFLAIPWLKSQGIEIHAVDTEASLDRRWRALPYGTRNYLSKQHLDKYCLTYSSHDFSQGGMSNFASHTDTHQRMVGACKQSYQQGYFCYDEMFVWANRALDECPTIAASLRRRFPLVFIDEVQDNSELQSALLHRVFFEGEKPSIRQRFGDSNQAIFQHNESSAETDKFPASPHVDLPNSHRFGAEIAKLADPLGVRPHGLVGCGPRISPKLGAPANTIFLFDEESIYSVLPSFAQHLLDSFTPDELTTAHFSAVAAVHNKEGEDKIPRSLKHYAPDYDPTIAAADCKPSTLLQYVRAARGHTLETSNVFQLVRGFANGIVQLAGSLPGSLAKPTLSQSTHRSIEKSLAEHPDRIVDYRSTLRMLVDCAGLPTQTEWENEICPRVRSIATALASVASLSVEEENFLSWTQPVPSDGSTQSRRRDNVFSYPEDTPTVRIHLGSIHSVKGETHTATLVLDTYFKKHHLLELKPFLLGKKKGGTSGTPTLQNRMRLHYVGMTRPANLLCLAMRKDAFSDAEKKALEERGWRLVQCDPVSVTMPPSSSKTIQELFD